MKLKACSAAISTVKPDSGPPDNPVELTLMSLSWVNVPQQLGNVPAQQAALCRKT